LFPVWSYIDNYKWFGVLIECGNIIQCYEETQVNLIPEHGMESCEYEEMSSMLPFYLGRYKDEWAQNQSYHQAF